MSEYAVPRPRAPALTLARVRLPQGAALLSIGTLASGVLAYGFNLVAARSLGPAAYGPIAVLWATMFLVSVVLFRPAEQTLARYIAERLVRGEDARPVARAVAWLTLAALAVVTVATVAAWEPMTHGLFAGHDYLTACLLASVAAYALSYYVRGVSSGLQWFGGYGVLLLVDGAARMIIVAPLLLVASPPVAAVAIVGAALLGPVVPLLSRSTTPRRLAARLHGDAAPPLGLADAARFALPVGIVAGAEQTMVSGGALLAALTADGDAAAAAGTVFAATMLVRAPVFLFQGVAAALLPRFTELYARGATRPIRRALLGAGAATVALSVVLAAGALVVRARAHAPALRPRVRGGRRATLPSLRRRRLLSRRRDALAGRVGPRARRRAPRWLVRGGGAFVAIDLLWRRPAAPRERRVHGRNLCWRDLARDRGPARPRLALGLVDRTLTCEILTPMSRDARTARLLASGWVRPTHAPWRVRACSESFPRRVHAAIV